LPLVTTSTFCAAFVVDCVGAEQLATGEGGERWVVGGAEELWQDASVEAGGVYALSARGGSHLGAIRLDVGDEEVIQNVG